MAKYFDVEGARNAGYSDQEIQDYMASKNLSPKFSVGGFAKNVGKSAVGFGKNVVMAIPNLIGMGANIASGKQTLGDTGSALLKSLKDRYGGWDELARTAYFDPVGSLADVSVGASALGGLAKLGKAGEVANVLGKVSKATDPMALFGKVGSAATESARGLVSKTGKALTSEGENLLTKGLGSPKQLAKVKGVSGTSIDDLFRKYDLYDRSPEAFQQGADTAGNTVKEMLTAKPTSISTSKIVKMFDDEIAKLGNQAKTSSKAKLAMEELANRKQMFLNGIQGENYTPLYNNASKVYDIKKSFQSDIPSSSYGMSSQDIGKNAGTTQAYRTLLQGIEEQAPGIKQTGREQAALIKLKQMATDAQNRNSSRQNLNFTKFGGAGVGALAAGIPGAVTGFAMERIANSPQYLSTASKVLTSAGKALQKPMSNVVRNSLSKTNQIANKAYSIAKPVSRLMPSQTYKSPVSTKLEQKVPTYKQNVSPVTSQIKSSLPTAEDFYAEIRKKRGY